MKESCVELNSINLRKAIYKTDMSFTKIAEKIGVNKSTVCNWYNNKYRISEKNLKKLLPVLNEIQRQKGLEPYTIPYLKGETNCLRLDNETIYNRIYLKDEAIDTLEKIGTTETKQNQNALIPNTCPLTHIDTFNYVISNKELWETLYIEIGKALKDNFKEIKEKYTNGATIEKIHEIIKSLNVPMSNKLYDTIKNILNEYIKELLGYYFPNE